MAFKELQPATSQDLWGTQESSLWEDPGLHTSHPEGTKGRRQLHPSADLPLPGPPLLTQGQKGQASAAGEETGRREGRQAGWGKGGVPNLLRVVVTVALY